MAQRLNGSTAQRCWCVVIVWIAGCDVRASVPARVDSSPGPSSQPIAIDGGVVLADQLGYRCLPFESVGLRPDAQVVSITASCPCVAPRVVTYVKMPARPSGQFLSSTSAMTTHWEMKRRRTRNHRHQLAWPWRKAGGDNRRSVSHVLNGREVRHGRSVWHGNRLG